MIEPVTGLPAVWEGCQTFSDSWGYHRQEGSWKSAKQCISMLIRHVARNGNLLLNVGPTSRGFFDDRAMTRLADYAKWMKYNSPAIYGCGQAPPEFPEPKGGLYTYNAAKKILYVHCLDYYMGNLILPGLAKKVKYVQLLHDQSQLTGCHTEGNDFIIPVPVVLQFENELIPVIEVFLK